MQLFQSKLCACYWLGRLTDDTARSVAFPLLLLLGWIFLCSCPSDRLLWTHILSPYCIFLQKFFSGISAYPKSILFIVGNEFCERFTYYGLRGECASWWLFFFFFFFFFFVIRNLYLASSYCSEDLAAQSVRRHLPWENKWVSNDRLLEDVSN